MKENTEHLQESAAGNNATAIFSTLIDNNLVEGCARNDKSAQKAFYNRYSAIIMGICQRYSSGEKDVIPMCVFVFRRLFKELRDCPKDSDLKQWIEGRVIWNAVHYLHQDKHTFFIAKTTRYEEKQYMYDEINEAALTPEACREIYLTALQSLTPSFRILYNLTYIDEVPKDVIIKKLQIASETYKAELGEARYQFKKQLNIQNYEYQRRHG